MKILVLCAALDLSKPVGSTPYLWQLFKGLREVGHQLILIPYYGRDIQTIWWSAIPNPNYYKGLALERFLALTRHSHGRKNFPLIPFFARAFAKPKIEAAILKILQSEPDIDALLVINIPLNQIVGMPKEIRRTHNIPIIFYDVDVPMSLPSQGGLTFNYYMGADLTEYDSFIIPSEGSVNAIKELGANHVDVIHFGVDPSAFITAKFEQDIDFFFFGSGGKFRQNALNLLITEPSKKLPYKFIVSGIKYQSNINLGRSVFVPPPSFTEWQHYCRRAKVNLNAVRDLNAEVYATSSSRPFELAAMKCCVVSSPYKGLDGWFEPGKEVLIVDSVEECIEVYRNLMTDADLRERIAEAAYRRVIKDHTTKHRARQMAEIIHSRIF